jgi:flagellar motility protein MotE (MotC chaperone)
MVDEQEKIEPAGDENKTSKPESSALNMKTVLIGVVTFVVFMIVFLVMGGAFSSTPPPAITEETTDTSHANQEAISGEEGMSSGGWHEGYSHAAMNDGSEKADSAMSEEDSIKQVKWYIAQKEEIDRERTKLRAEEAQLKQLQMETQALLERRAQVEQTNIANLAKLFETMKSEEVASIMANIPNEKVGLILQKMKKESASKVMASLPSERAAKITMELIDLGGEF